MDMDAREPAQRKPPEATSGLSPYGKRKRGDHNGPHNNMRPIFSDYGRKSHATVVVRHVVKPLNAGNPAFASGRHGSNQLNASGDNHIKPGAQLNIGLLFH